MPRCHPEQIAAYTYSNGLWDGNVCKLLPHQLANQTQPHLSKLTWGDLEGMLHDLSQAGRSTKQKAVCIAALSLLKRFGKSCWLFSRPLTL